MVLDLGSRETSLFLSSSGNVGMFGGCGGPLGREREREAVSRRDSNERVRVPSALPPLRPRPFLDLIPQDTQRIFLIKPLLMSTILTLASDTTDSEVQ